MQQLAVPPLQMVLRGSELDPSALDLVENPSGNSPWTFENAEQKIFVPRLGGQDFLRLAIVGQSSGYKVSRFELLDDRFELVRNEKFERKASEKLLKALAHGGVAEANALMTHEYVHYLLSGVELQSAMNPFVIVRRNGVVLTQGVETVRALLQAFWRSVRA